ncbi:MAG: hypothetical protein Q9187_002814 [Circinaria calcarea]
MAHQYGLFHYYYLMSRHNRRRTRGGHKLSDIALRQSTLDLSSTSITQIKPSNYKPWAQFHAGRNDFSARHWHSRYLAWQVRERRQLEEREKLEADQRRIFGGESGEDDEDGLCHKMLEYFGSLDFIDDPRCFGSPSLSTPFS